MFEKLKEKYIYYRDLAFLKKHGCKTWKEYHRKFDPDCNIGARRIKDIYYGYPYVYCFENHQHSVYDWDVGYDGSYVVTKWCEENLTGKFRLDVHRVILYNGIWEINEIGGGDYVFAAFKDPKDFTHFLLRWG